MKKIVTATAVAVIALGVGGTASAHQPGWSHMHCSYNGCFDHGPPPTVSFHRCYYHDGDYCVRYNRAPPPPPPPHGYHQHHRYHGYHGPNHGYHHGHHGFHHGHHEYPRHGYHHRSKTSIRGVIHGKDGFLDIKQVFGR